jgi:CRISPR/Cas system-associated exonuclease Cas4 (RecB family)
VVAAGVVRAGPEVTTLQRMSPSRAAKFGQCGEQYRLAYIEQVPRRPSIAALGGRATHTCLEETELYRLGRGVDYREFPVVFDEELARAEEESGLSRDQFKVSGRKTKALPNGETIDYWREELGPWMVAATLNYDWGDRWRIADGDELPPDRNGKQVGLEYEVEIDGVFLGIIDRLEIDQFGNFRAVDYKTGRARKTVQLQQYMSALKMMGVRCNYAAYFYTRKNELSEVKTSAWSEDTFMEFQSRYQVAIEDKRYVPVPGDHCSWCDVRDHCAFASGVA